MRLAAALAVALIAGSSVIGAEVRPASEMEIAEALVGCWRREAPPGVTYGSRLCFDKEGKVTSASWSYLEGHDETGTFRVVSGKLQLSQVNPFGTGSPSVRTSCDVLMRPDVAMRFEHCTQGDVGSADVYSDVGKISFLKVPE